MCCWIQRGDGYILLDDTGAVVGEIANLDKETYGQGARRLYKPSEWFEWHVHKRRERTEIA